MNDIPDHEILNRISERLFGYREGSNQQILQRIDELLKLEKTAKISRTARTKVNRLRRIARELFDVIEGPQD